MVVPRRKVARVGGDRHKTQDEQQKHLDHCAQSSVQRGSAHVLRMAQCKVHAACAKMDSGNSATARSLVPARDAVVADCRQNEEEEEEYDEEHCEDQKGPEGESGVSRDRPIQARTAGLGWQGTVGVDPVNLLCKLNYFCTNRLETRVADLAGHGYRRDRVVAVGDLPRSPGHLLGRSLLCRSGGLRLRAWSARGTSPLGQRCL